MSYTIPSSRKEVSNRIKTDVKNSLEGSNPFLKNSFLQAISFGLSGRIYDLYKTSLNLIQEIFWDTASGDYLARHAAIFSITRNPATSSSGELVAYGIVLTNIPIGTQLQSSDNKTYETQTSVNIANESLELASLTRSGAIATAITSVNHNFAAGIPITISGANETEYNGTFIIQSVPTPTTFTYDVDEAAITPATGTIFSESNIAVLQVVSIDTGNDTTRENGESLFFASPIAGVEDTAYVKYDGISGGVDLESDDDFRNRFLFRVQNPIALFNDNAIINEARKISGVTRVWVRNVDTTQGSLTASSLTFSSGVAFFTTAAPHGLKEGQKVTITGAIETEYNVINSRIIIISTTTFCYAVTGTPSSPATGTILAAYSLVQEGQVKILFVRDNDTPINPNASEITETKNQILTIKPAHVSDNDVIVDGPSLIDVDFVFTSINPESDTMKNAVIANIQAFFRDKTEPGRNITENEYITAIQNTIDPDSNRQLTSFVLSSPSGDIAIGRNELGTSGSITI